MKIILFIINFVISLYGSAPIFVTGEALPEDRQGQVYITVDYGICLDDVGNGLLYGYDSDHNYISYSSVHNAKAGDMIYTFCVMNPDNNYFDDIICRIDMVIESEDISINMDDVEEQIITEYGLQLYLKDGTGYYFEW